MLEALLDQGHELILSKEIAAEVTRVLRYPRLQSRYNLTEADLLGYAQFLQNVSALVILDPQFVAFARRERLDRPASGGSRRSRCALHQRSDFSDPIVVSYCAAHGIEICTEAELLARLTRRG